MIKTLLIVSMLSCILHHIIITTRKSTTAGAALAHAHVNIIE